MKRSYAKQTEGFVSVYFLSFLLYISAAAAAVIENDCARMRTIMNLQEDEEYFMQERIEIEKLKCQLQCSLEKTDDNAEETEQEYTDGTVYLEIAGEKSELLTVYYEVGTHRVIDYESIRY
ncbi:MAG: hypothetical protein LKF53_02310 [Solobacterium sp.]|jgi:hypothetical protein|nr:hypothetical protein [Solobacterium sp.]MCH4205210.1 hypothetical protein [Solobacterium sp.]MCH4226803.1 hypothetical protein [Solobacterium sp.]MCH4281563.1 hypothetical protein [Solobacterium sp.]